MTDGGRPRATFRTTHWSVVRDAAGAPGGAAGPALETLAGAYWPPLYAFLRRAGHSGPDAEDLVQGFFARLLEKGWLAQADPARGRFRTYLLAALKHFVAHERERARALKRGGGRARVSLADLRAEDARLGGLKDRLTPEQAFERRYAEALLGRALARLAATERDASGERARRFDALAPLLWDDAAPRGKVAQALGLAAPALRVALYRLRLRLRDAIRAEVAATVDDPAQVDAEIACLIAALGD